MDESKHRWFCPAPSWLVYGSLLVTGLLFLSERWQWFPFNAHKGWTVLVAVAGIGVVLLAMLLWLVVALVFRWRFQFGIRTLLVLVVAVALPCSWLGLEMRKAKRQREVVQAIEKTDGHVIIYDWVKDSDPLVSIQRIIDDFDHPHRNLLWRLFGDDFFADVVEAGFGGKTVTDEKLTRIHGLDDLPKLRSLTFHYTGITDDGLAHLKCLKQLEVLDIDNALITDTGLSKIAGMTQLKELHVQYTKTTDAGLRNLAGLSQLEEIYLGYTAVTDAGLEQLARLPRLRLVALGGTRVTDNGKKSLRQMQPNCKIIY